MSFCPNCGTKLQDGDTFCGDCGARLAGVNNNSKQNTQQPYVIVANINTEAVSKHSKQTLAIILNTIVKPVSTIKDLVNALDQKSTLILGVVLVLIQGIFSLWKLHQFISTLDKSFIKFATAMGKIMNSIGGGDLGIFSASDLLGISGEYNQTLQLIKVPSGNAFLHGIILYLVVAGVMSLGIFVVAKLLSKSNVNASNIGRLVILSTVPALGGEFLSIIFSYFSSTMGILVLLMGILVSFAIVILNVKEIVEIENDKLVYVLAVVFAIVIACALFAIWKFVISDIYSIKNSIMNDVMMKLK